jgi:hypothetical protein
MAGPGKNTKKAAARKGSSSAPGASAAPIGKESLNNLEMKGDRLKVFSLQTLLTNKKSRETREVARLGDVLLPWYEKTVTKPAEKLSGIAELWQEHVPAAIVERSRLIGFLKGTLTVALDSATVRAELEGQLRGGLLRKLQVESRGAVYRVKTQIESIPTIS